MNSKLDFNADWVHVRISGLFRGWIWRNRVEMLEGVPDHGHARRSWTCARGRRVIPRDPRGDLPIPWRLGRGAARA